ncbi:Uncharacterized protein APZ42_021531 [Daphnia magna]|uniref:Uncharacterized protein n=1 Tax=Daphnia magna TaxID=35525 RepID=A0A164WL17_9CRUS|nr:Uncharacterized protein APZ42_021531 [Daphnia magna]
MKPIVLMKQRERQRKANSENRRLYARLHLPRGMADIARQHFYTSFYFPFVLT